MTKKFIFTIFICLLALSKVWAQSPNMINYQGVALNSGGTTIANQNISIRASVHNLTPTGTILYSEERSLTTETGGLFNFQIGGPGANATSGSWSAINWGTGAKHLQIEMDATGGTNFVDMGTQQLVSVPYAQYSSLSGALIPTATINPNQINAGGAATNQVLKYNGTTWVPGADVSAFALPYSGIDASALSSFSISNSNATYAVAIKGMSSGNGTTARGIWGSGTGTNGIGVYGTSDQSDAVVGVSTGGHGVRGTTSSVSDFGVYGTHTNGIAIKGQTTTGYGIMGEATGGSGRGVFGISNGASGRGISGESVSGIGVHGYGNNAGSYGLFGSSLSGTGVYATSFTGNALDVNGNVKIAGGNTNPSAGAVLTSDASGNATWKPRKVGFQADGTGGSTTIVASTITKVKFSTENYDASGNFNIEGAAVDKSTFIAPVSGLYHFDTFVKLHVNSSVSNLTIGFIEIKVNGGTVRSRQYDDQQTSLSFHSYIYASLNEDIHLNSGDKVTVHVYQTNTTNVTGDAIGEKFSGHLIFAD